MKTTHFQGQPSLPRVVSPTESVKAPANNHHSTRKFENTFRSPSCHTGNVHPGHNRAVNKNPTAFIGFGSQMQSDVNPGQQQHLSSSPATSFFDSNVYNPAVLSQNVVALVCEMVGVGPNGKRSVLARVSMVDYFGKCILDRFVRVEERVTDFRTHVSGVCPADLKSKETVSYGEVRKSVVRLLRNKLLVGHGLDNHLAVLGIYHDWYAIRDIATYYPFMWMDNAGRPQPSRLKDLAKQRLGLSIQEEGVPHDSLEDASASMVLYRRVQMEWDQSVEYRRRSVAQQTGPGFGRNMRRPNHGHYVGRPWQQR